MFIEKAVLWERVHLIERALLARGIDIVILPEE